MPLPLTVFCFSKIQIGFTFLVPAHLGSPGQRAIKRVCVCVCVCVCVFAYIDNMDCLLLKYAYNLAETVIKVLEGQHFITVLPKKCWKIA